MDLARQFDPAALAEIYDRYSPGIYRYALRLLGDPDQAEECTAETFSRFLAGLHAGRGPEDHLQAYLYRMAHNWITDQYRREPPLLLTEELPGTDTDPGLLAAEKIERDQVRAALARLTPEQRQVVVLKFLEGWQNEDVAKAVGRPVGAVKSLQHRAIDTLKRMLLPQERRQDERTVESN